MQKRLSCRKDFHAEEAFMQKRLWEDFGAELGYHKAEIQAEESLEHLYKCASAGLIAIICDKIRRFVAPIY